MLITSAENYRAEVIQLLATEKLPVGDLPGNLENFLVAVINGEVTGVIGMEMHGDVGLLRSMAVAPGFRGKDIAHKLILAIEQLARDHKLNTIYLLTETASGYLSRKGYQQIARDDAPGEIKHTSEFSQLCPQTAVVMNKSL